MSVPISKGFLIEDSEVDNFSIAPEDFRIWKSIDHIAEAQG
jgi:hypothetical protein